jgi:hypothetical protein
VIRLSDELNAPSSRTDDHGALQSGRLRRALR